MKKKNSNICRLFLTLLGLLMAIQICFGFAWMVVNLANIPIFGDSTEYFNLSQTLMVDEYRPLLYPLLIRIAVKMANHLPLAYQTLAYIGQTLLCILSAIFLSVQIDCYFQILKNKTVSCFIWEVYSRACTLPASQ